MFNVRASCHTNHKQVAAAMHGWDLILAFITSFVQLINIFSFYYIHFISIFSTLLWCACIEGIFLSFLPPLLYATWKVGNLELLPLRQCAAATWEHTFWGFFFMPFSKLLLPQRRHSSILAYFVSLLSTHSLQVPTLLLRRIFRIPKRISTYVPLNLWLKEGKRIIKVLCRKCLAIAGASFYEA